MKQEESDGDPAEYENFCLREKFRLREHRSALPTKMVDRRRENMELFSYWYAKRRSLPNFDFSIGAIDIVISVEGC